MTIEVDGRWWLDRAFVYLGRMDPSKGVEVMIRAFASLASEVESLPPLWLVGGIPGEIERVRASLTDVIAPIEARKLLSWWGFQRPAAVSALFSRALVLLMHSQYEPGGRVVLEALAAGLPVIATPNGFASELVHDWISGFVVPYGDVDLLRTRMAHFIRQPLLRNAMGARGRALALDALNAWRFVDAHCEVYDNALLHSESENRTGFDRVLTPPRGDVLRTRSFPPTYPWTRAPADDGTVASFIGRYRSALRVLPRTNDAIPLWRGADGRSEWVVKQVEGRFNVRVLWDPHAGPDLVRTADARFTMEVFAASLPPFAPLSAHSEEHGFVLRPAGEVALLTPETIGSLAGVLRALGRYEMPELSARLPRSLSSASRDELAGTLAVVRLAAKEAYPNWQCSTLTAELGWRLRLYDLASGALRLGDDWTSVDWATAERLTERASRAESRVVVTHGDPDPSHFLWYGETLQLISGGNLECAAAGKDFGAFLLHVLIQCDFTAALALLEACDSGEADAALVWAGLLAVDGLCRNTVLRRRARVACYWRLWSFVRDLLAVSQ
jgi:hypothetical protein